MKRHPNLVSQDDCDRGYCRVCGKWFTGRSGTTRARRGALLAHIRAKLRFESGIRCPSVGIVRPSVDVR